VEPLAAAAGIGNAGGSGVGMAAAPLWIIFFLATSIAMLRRDAAVVSAAT
jgi:hypothetical protein